MNGPLQRRDIHFSGMVQGVGFRYTTQRIAAEFPVVGWVQNLADGRVRLMVQGTTDQIDCFLGAVHSRLGSYITATHQTLLDPSNELRSFEIRFR